MKSKLMFGLVLSACFFACVPSFGAETAAANASSETEVVAKAPDLIMSYSYFKWVLRGTNTANTNIYEFGNSTVDLHMLTATWLYSPKWTFLAFAPYLKYMVETIYEPTPSGLNFKTRDTTEGLGDLRFMAMTPLWAQGTQILMGDVSITAPTGSTNQYFTSAPKQRAAYNMQMGSGTPDVIGALGYSETFGAWDSFGRTELTIRGGKNAEGYNLGDEFQAHIGTHYAVWPSFKLGAVYNYKARQAIQGHDDKYELYNNYVSPVDPSIHGDGHQYYHAPQIFWDASLTAKWQAALFGRYSAMVEAGLPVWQGAINKDNIRLDTQSWFSATLNAAF